MSQPLDPVTERLNDLILDVDASFTNDPANHPVMSEVFFVNVFLPMFAGDENPKHPATIQTWLNVAHSPFNEVHVVDAQNQILFTVPALASQAAIKPLDGTGQAARMQTVTDMVATARLYANRGANVVQHFITQEMDKRSFLFNVKTMDAAHIQRWNEIFARYNRPLLPVAAGATDTTAPHDHDIARDSSEFDELGS